MLVDLHNHTELCCHACGTMEDYVRQAIAKGISIFGFADHSPWMLQEDIKMALSYEEVPIYVERVRNIQRQFSSAPDAPINILMGMEMDFLPDDNSEALRFLKEYDFDYAIGSVHYIGTWGFDQEEQIARFQNESVRQIYEHYFGLVKELVKSGIFDIMGHLDLIKKFGYFPESGWDDIQEDVARIIGESGMAVELNTSGMDKPVHEFYPTPQFLKRLHKHGVPITLGSDSHRPMEVGRYFDRAISLLREIGYKEIAYFEKRKMIPVKI